MIDGAPGPPLIREVEDGQHGAPAVPPEARAAVGGHRPRLLVLEALASCGFVSAQELHARLRLGVVGAIGLNTVYATLRLLRDAGYADTVHDSRAGQLFALRATRGHDHYLRCEICGDTTPIPSTEIETLLNTVVQRTGWSSVSHTLELTGRCPSCRSQLPP